MKRLLLSLTLAVCCVALVLPANAQSERGDITPSTAAPFEPTDEAPSTPIVDVLRIDEGITYGQHNRPGTETDCYGSFDPEDTFSAECGPLYATSAFAGGVVTTDEEEGILYYPLQGAVNPDTLGAFNFDTMEELEQIPLTYFDIDGNEIPSDLAPQWVDGGIDTETGEVVLLGRFQACVPGESGGQLWSMDVSTGVVNQMLTFTDPNNCPLSGAYDNENNRFIGMVPDKGIEGFYQTDLTTGETVGMIPLPDDMEDGVVAQFIQGGATNHGFNSDPSDNEAWIFLFEGVDTNASTSRLITFDGDGIISGQENFGDIDANADWVEVLTTGFKSMVAVSNESAVAAGTFEFIGVFPNPFQGTASVMLRANEPVEQATVKAYDVLGRQVATLHDGPLAATQHQFGLEAQDLPSGVYFVSIRSGDFSQTKKVVLVD